MEGDRGRSTHFVSLRLRNFIIGSVQLMLGVCLLSFHVLNLIKIIEKRDLFDNLSTFLPDDEKSSHQTYHIASSVLASIMIVFTFILFWGIFDYKDNLVWGWILANSMLCIIYIILGLYGVILHYWFVLENFTVTGCIISFIYGVFPYYKWLCRRNLESSRINNAKETTSKKVPK
ncbi:uncharacterized protein [Halyomorpha halys]|uniref:uncharacterized protein isoform X1 n=1 Tax=Halyomorpha halys TaxID=286706 RepID=UPI0006D4D5AF|nr:uncharacterized protein LOC106691170 isoform X1 [Halyomorpha halys]XP_014292334.1 uncharacterized protein LOC106691170 isoform X1 [Halyomorpha halys]XP_014292335.1 uncharacterized protein LOC106691170 isoform X1 [Halyomorpha halys]